MNMPLLQRKTTSTDSEDTDMNGKIYCDKCGADFILSLQERKEGDLDITFIQCPHCHEEYLVSVTDSVLRDAIKEHQGLMDKVRTATDAETSNRLIEAAREMKENNLKRCSELMIEYHTGKETAK